MITRRHFSPIERLARVALRAGDAAAQRAAMELAAQLRNEARELAGAPADGGVLSAGEAMALDRDLAANLQSILDRQRRIDTPDDGGPTPETRAKRRTDVIGAMVKAGTLSAQEADAAELIERGWRLATGDVSHFRQVRYEEPTDASRAETWTEAQERTWRRFERWRDEALEKELPVDAVITVIAEPVGIRQAEERHAMRNGTLTPKLQEALGLYVTLAGWRTAVVV